jgi:hypothetical protein
MMNRFRTEGSPFFLRRTPSQFFQSSILKTGRAHSGLSRKHGLTGFREWPTDELHDQGWIV